MHCDETLTTSQLCATACFFQHTRQASSPGVVQGSSGASLLASATSLVACAPVAPVPCHAVLRVRPALLGTSHACGPVVAQIGHGSVFGARLAVARGFLLELAGWALFTLIDACSRGDDRQDKRRVKKMRLKGKQFSTLTIMDLESPSRAVHTVLRPNMVVADEHSLHLLAPALALNLPLGQNQHLEASIEPVPVE